MSAHEDGGGEALGRLPYVRLIPGVTTTWGRGALRGALLWSLPVLLESSTAAKNTDSGIYTGPRLGPESQYFTRSLESLCSMIIITDMWLRSQEKGCKEAPNAFCLLTDTGTGYRFPMQIRPGRGRTWTTWMKLSWVSLISGVSGWIEG